MENLPVQSCPIFYRTTLNSNNKVCDNAADNFGSCGPHQCSADTGADTWRKQALCYMPVWPTLAEQVQIPYHARLRVLKNTVTSNKHAGDELSTKTKECGNSNKERSTIRQPNRSSLKANKARLERHVSNRPFTQLLPGLETGHPVTVSESPAYDFSVSDEQKAVFPVSVSDCSECDLCAGD